MGEILLGADGMTLEELVLIARKGANVRIAEEAKKKILEARELVEKWVREGKVVYGVTTGFGALSDRVISREEISTVDRSLWLSTFSAWPSQSSQGSPSGG
jgi:histidine ammonia-lyase